MADSSTYKQRSWSEILKPAFQTVELDGREIFFLVVYTLTLGVISAAVPMASQIMVNQVAFTGAAPPIIALAAIVFGVLLIGAFIRLFQIRVSALIAKRTFVRSALQGTHSLLGSPSRSYELDDREIANRFFDVMTFQTAFGILASEGLGVIIVGAVGIAILALYHPIFFAFSVFVGVACFIVMWLVAKRMIARCTQRSKDKYKIAFWLSQVAENRSLLRQTKENRLVQERTDLLAGAYVRSYFDYLRMLLWQSGSLFLIQALASAAFFGVGGWLVVGGQLNLGQLVAAEIIVLANLSSLSRFYYYLDAFYEAVVAADKVGELVTLPSSTGPAAAAVHDAKVHGLTITSKLLGEPLKLKAGDVVVLRGPSRRNCSVVLRGIAASDRLDDVSIQWDSSVYLSRENGPNQVLYLARPTVLRMSLAENLCLLSDAETMVAARDAVLDNPLLRPTERTAADQYVNEAEMSISDRSRYAVARALSSNRPVVLIDMFFNLMELEDQVTFVREFKARFPDRILIINAFDSAIDPLVSRIVTVGGSGA